MLRVHFLIYLLKLEVLESQFRYEYWGIWFCFYYMWLGKVLKVLLLFCFKLKNKEEKYMLYNIHYNNFLFSYKQMCWINENTWS